MKRVKALWLEDNTLSLREVDTPVRATGEALLRLRLAGICGTDLEMARGYYDYTGVPGHEFVAEVVEAPDRPSLIGTRVVGEINATCGSCEACRSSRANHCEQRTVLGIAGRGGVFAETFTLPVRNLHPVPDTVSDTAAVFTEPLAAACRIGQQIPLGRGDRVLIIGAGRLGQLVAQVVAHWGCELDVVTKHPVQRALLDRRDIRTVEGSELGARNWDVVVEATGNPDGFALATRAVRPAGTIVLKSTYRGSPEVDFSSLVVDEITLVGSRCGPFPEALELLADSRVDVEMLVERRFPLTEALEAFSVAKQPGAMKVLMVPD